MIPATTLAKNTPIVKATKQLISSHLSNFRLIMADATGEFRNAPPRSALLVMRVEVGDGGCQDYYDDAAGGWWCPLQVVHSNSQ